MRKTCIIALLLVQSALLMGYLDLERIFSFDLDAPYSFAVSSSGEGSYYYLETGGVVETELLPWVDGWKQGSLAEPAYLGFKTGILGLLNPIYNLSEPAFAAYTPYQTDPQGDQAIEDVNLDLLESRVSFDDERIYFAIRNATGLYPVNSGLNFNAYMSILANPLVDFENTPVAYGLIYTVNLGMLLSPGLYKITGTSLEGLQRLGDIEYQVLGEWLFLSCALDDLYSDADVGDWLLPDYPLFASATATAQLSMNTGIQEGDYTIPGFLLLKAQYVSGENNFSPVISDISYDLNLEAMELNSLQLNYSDGDSNVPHQAYLSIDGTQQHQLDLQNPDYVDFGVSALYGISNLSLPGDWESISIVFSDGEEYVEENIANPSSNEDDIQSPALSVRIFPNPATSALKISSSLPAASGAAIYNLRGQKLKDLRFQSGKSEQILDLSQLPAGLYFLKVQGFGTRKFIVVK